MKIRFWAHILVAILCILAAWFGGWALTHHSTNGAGIAILSAIAGMLTLNTLVMTKK